MRPSLDTTDNFPPSKFVLMRVFQIF
jgi:hypothetical protein